MRKTLNIVRYIALTLTAFFLITMVFVQYKISLVTNDPNYGCDYVILLGAGLKNNRPTLALRYRIEKAIEYMDENAGCKLILSGGQGANEDISEALAMKNYILENSNIDKSRLIIEDKSTDTKENIKYSKKIIDSMKTNSNIKVGVISNDFHIYRATMIMRKTGIENPYPIPAKTPDTPFLKFNLRLREYFSIMLEYVGL